MRVLSAAIQAAQAQSALATVDAPCQEVDVAPVARGVTRVARELMPGGLIRGAVEDGGDGNTEDLALGEIRPAKSSSPLA